MIALYRVRTHTNDAQCRPVRLGQYVKCKPGPPAYIRDPACIQGPASIGTTMLDSRPVFEARLLFKARLLFEEIRYIKITALMSIRQLISIWDRNYIKEHDSILWVNLKLLSITTTTTITITRHYHHHFNGHLPGEHWLATFSVFTLHLFGKEPLGMGDVVQAFIGQTPFLSSKQQCQSNKRNSQHWHPTQSSAPNLEKSLTDIILSSFPQDSWWKGHCCPYASNLKSVPTSYYIPVMRKYKSKPGIQRVQALAGISRSHYVVIAMKPKHQLEIRSIVHN